MNLFPTIDIVKLGPRMNDFPVFPLSNSDLSKLFEVYESFNAKYDGFKFEDVV